MGNAEWPQRMSDSLKRNVGEKEAELIIEGCDKLCEMDEKNRAKWMAQAMDRLDSHVADEKTKIKIMTDCCCRCYEEHILELRRVWKGTGDVDALIDVMTGKVFLRRPERDGNIVYVTKAPRFPEEHAGAKTKEEKKYYFCHCDYARAAMWSRPFCRGIMSAGLRCIYNRIYIQQNRVIITRDAPGWPGQPLVLVKSYRQRYFSILPSVL